MEEYFKKQKNELEELKTKLSNSIRQKTILSELQLAFDNNDRLITSYFDTRKTCLENLRNKIDLLMLEEDELRMKIREIIHNFFRDECGKRLDNPLKELEAYLHKIQIFIREWEIYNRVEKAKLLKADTVTEFKVNANELNEVIKFAVELFKGKTKVLESNLIELLKSISYNDKLPHIDAEIDKVSEKLKENYEKVEKINFEDLLVEEKKKEEVVPKVEPKIEMQKHVQPLIEKIPTQIKPEDKNYPTFEKISQPEFSLLRDIPFIENNPKPLIFNPVELKQKNPYFVENTYNYELFISIKQKTDNIFIYNGKTTEFHTFSIKPENFQDKSTAFNTIPDNCRFVNIHSSILITGGYVNKQVSKLAYLLVVYPKDSQYEINIIPYANMLSVRERHNMINLYDRKQILVCSGFFNNSAEITNLDHGSWKPLPNMNSVRANATIAYVNKKNVFVFGGFRINEKQVGEYQNSCEVINLDDNNAGWKLIKFDHHNLNMRLSAMGVINYSENTLLLCGGFDGTTYRSDIYKLDLKDIEIVNYEKTNMVLPGNLIFIHNNFVRIGDTAFNYDLQNNLFAFNPETNSFKMHMMLR
jgi:hypothetical protein